MLSNMLQKNLIFIRNYSRKRISQAKLNPGVNRINKIINDENPEEFEDDVFHDYESDFMSVHKSHSQHVSEMKTMMEKEKYLIVKQKYFKETNPNFLTWHDKEQIRYLHNKDPIEWNIEKLSEGFPALPDIIHKIIRGNWVKKNTNNIGTHDLHVQKNWELFQKGKMKDLSDELNEHLKKFTNRSLNLSPYVQPLEKKTENLTKSVPDGFSEIISSYERLKNKNFVYHNDKNTLVECDSVKENNNSDTYVLGNGKEKGQSVTLEALTRRLQKKFEKKHYLSPDEQILLQKIQQTAAVKEQCNADKINDIAVDVVEINENKHVAKVGNNSNQLSVDVKTRTNLSVVTYPENITIPSKLRKRGCTYKLNDCYYDDDGEFLYRVPGMG